MGNLQTGQAKFERKMQTAGEKWASKKGQMQQNYPRGLADAGMPPGPITVASYDAGINSVSAGDFQQAVSGKGQKWAENTRAGIAR